MITTTVQFNDFWSWLLSSGGYKDNFSYNGAKALFDYLDELSEETGDANQNMDFDPVAWCVEFTEYESVDDFNDQYFGKEYQKGSEYTLETLQDNTLVIEFDTGIIVQDF